MPDLPTLNLPPARSGNTLASPAQRWLSAFAGSARRERLEGFVRDRFAECYGARIQRFMPELIGIEGSDGGLRAVAGLRPAASGPLFLEHYLDQPVEDVIARVVVAAPAREHIVEVGNLAVREAGYTRALIAMLTLRLLGAGYEWVVFTGTGRLINSFHRLGLAPLRIGVADPGRLGAEAADWGSYYAHGPQVMAGRIADGCARMPCGDVRPPVPQETRRVAVA